MSFVERCVVWRLISKYHGWQFNDKAECDYIPAQPDKKPTKANHCDSLPCIERYEAVWVWLAEEDSNVVTEQQRMAKFPDSLFKYYDDSSFIRNTGSRDLEIDHGLMIENLLDPAHLPFTHEGTLAKRSDAQLLEMDVDWNTCTRDKPPTDEQEWYSAGQGFGAPGFQTTAFRPNAEPAKKRLGSFCTRCKLFSLAVFLAALCICLLSLMPSLPPPSLNVALMEACL